MTKEIFTDDELSRLNVDLDHLGQPVRVTLATGDDVARGFVDDRERVVEEIADQGTAHLLDIGEVALAGFRLAHFEDWPELVRVWAPDDSFSLVDGDDSTHTYSMGDGEFFIESDKAQFPVAIVNSRGEGLIIGRSNIEGLVLAPLVNLPATLADAPELPDVPPEWLDECGDAWLERAAGEKLASGDAWSKFVAVGMLHRFSRPESSEEAASLVEQILAGEEVPSERRAMSWAQELSDETVQKLTSRAMATAESIQWKLGGLGDDGRLGVTVSETELAPACHARDDLESAAVLLAARSSGEQVRDALHLLDRMGSDIMEKVSSDVDLRSDDQLRRAVISNPEGWWTFFADSSEA